jgi:hypothetical protein
VSHGQVLLRHDRAPPPCSSPARASTSPSTTAEHASYSARLAQVFCEVDAAQFRSARLRLRPLHPACFLVLQGRSSSSSARPPGHRPPLLFVPVVARGHAPSRSSPTFVTPSARTPSSAVCACMQQPRLEHTVIQSFKLHVRVLFPRGCSMPSSAQLQFVLLIPTREHHF